MNVAFSGYLHLYCFIEKSRKKYQSLLIEKGAFPELCPQTRRMQGIKENMECTNADIYYDISGYRLLNNKIY